MTMEEEEVAAFIFHLEETVGLGVFSLCLFSPALSLSPFCVRVAVSPGTSLAFGCGFGGGCGHEVVVVVVVRNSMI